LGLQYFNTGMVMSMIEVAIQYMFLQIYGIEPMKANLYLSYINLPWTPKILYGIITDCFPIFGSSKRAYIVLMGFVQSMAALAIATIRFEEAKSVMLLALVSNFGGAFMDVIADGMMVVNARKDPVGGSEDLQSYSWIFYGLGGIFGCGLSGWLLSGQPDPVTGEATG
jgi:hypothetical protein